MGEELLFGGRLRLRQQEGVFPLSMDTMALADFCTLAPGQRVWDLGCGSGALGLLLLGRESTLRYTGVDISPQAVALAGENLAQNGFAAEIFPQNIVEMGKTAPVGAADLVISNPPYFPPGRGKPGTAARTGCSLEELCAAAGRLLKNGGKFAFIYPTTQLAQAFFALNTYGMEPKRLRLVAHDPAAIPKLALIEGRKQGKPGLLAEPNLNWYELDGTPSVDYQRIYHMETAPNWAENGGSIL
jgi:tRNA1(Val) A37 N6-methylase TrmN6